MRTKLRIESDLGRSPSGRRRTGALCAAECTAGRTARSPTAGMVLPHFLVLDCYVQAVL